MKKDIFTVWVFAIACIACLVTSSTAVVGANLGENNDAFLQTADAMREARQVLDHSKENIQLPEAVKASGSVGENHGE